MRSLIALTKPGRRTSPRSSGTCSAPAASSAARYLSEVRREPKGESGSASDLATVELGETGADARLGVEEAVPHAQREGELLDEPRLQSAAPDGA